VSELFRNAGISADLLRLLTWGLLFGQMHCKAMRRRLPWCESNWRLASQDAIWR